MSTGEDGRLSRWHQICSTARVLRDAGLIKAFRPDKYLRIAAAARRQGATHTIGLAVSARRCPNRVGLIDELGALTFAELDQRANAVAAALQELDGGTPRRIGIMCRNHRGFVDAMAAADRLGADVLLLNTSFAGPALADVVARELPDVIIYDEEFAGSVTRALGDTRPTHTLTAWTDGQRGDLESLIHTHLGRRPERTGRTGKLILLTSGTTGAPKGARRSAGGGASDLASMLSRVPWRAEQTTVVAAPMFHAWGFGQLVMGFLLSCTLVVRRRFDPAAIMALVDQYQATGLSIVPVMIDRIMELPDDVRRRFSGRSLRFVTASGSRMRSDTMLRFMDEFGDVIYNNYNATEAGVIATATPVDLRAAPQTAGTPLDGVDVYILDDERRPLPRGEIGGIFVRSSSHFEGYTSGATKEFHDGYINTGDIGYLDTDGRLFVVGRDDEMIVSGGENVYPIEIEKALSTHQHVAEVSAIGVEDRDYGQRLVAFVVPVAGAPADVDTLKSHVRVNLASYKVPRDIFIVDGLPRTSTGKVLRAELKRLAAEKDDSRRDP
jgi:acyl-CoA synthetase (AMP-forming)/AMP-acid ligase II